MTEAEWLAATDPYDLLRHLEESGQPTGRKLRLFAAGCCRRVERLFADAALAVGVGVVERLADGWAAEADREAAEDAAREVRDGLDVEYDEAEDDARGAAFHSAWAVYEALSTDHPAGHYLGRLLDVCSEAADAAGYAASAEAGRRGTDPDDLPDALDRATERERRAQAGLLRDVFGNPFRPVTPDPSWLTPRVCSLADAIYADRAFDRMPILADALEEAGCDNPDVLTHCRSGGPHVRGCWVVDLVLGRE